MLSLPLKALPKLVAAPVSNRVSDSETALEKLSTWKFYRLFPDEKVMVSKKIYLLILIVFAIPILLAEFFGKFTLSKRSFLIIF